MASRAVTRIARSIVSQSVLPRVVIARALSADAGPRERIWSCSKEPDKSQIGLECLKDMVVDGDIQLFDVREPHELASGGKIPKSVNIPCKFVYFLLFDFLIFLKSSCRFLKYLMIKIFVLSGSENYLIVNLSLATDATTEHFSLFFSFRYIHPLATFTAQFDTKSKLFLFFSVTSC